jgi:hypothetical protein
VLGEALDICSTKPMTGFYRDGRCNTGLEDAGSRTICAVNDLDTKRWTGPPQRQEWETPMVVESAERRLVAAE